MVAKPPGRNRPVDVAISLPVGQFVDWFSDAVDGDFKSLVGNDGNPAPGAHSDLWCVDDPGRFSVELLKRSIFSKLDDGKSSKSKEEAALQKFHEAESRCADANRRLSPLVGLPAELARTDVERVLFLARKKIKRILGPVRLNEIADGFTFTSGASTRLRRARGAAAHKFSGVPETTYGNLALATAAICSVPRWEASLRSEIGPMAISIVHGNKITTVPKNWKTDRVIAIEPCMNMYVQKGIGNVIRRRLRDAGLDLNTQERNQRLARVGSIAGSLATIDLSMASDTVCLELVRVLLPPRWLDLLEQSRSQFGVLPCGRKVTYRKFSSMGNGYTFELESLIFWALSLAVCEHLDLETHRTVVFGDDIILPTDGYPLLRDVLQFAGFVLNEDKSFVTGPYRESCGKHWLNGYDVTPFFVKKWPTCLTELFKLHNKVWRWIARQGWNPAVTAFPEVLYNRIREKAPLNWRRPRIPDGFGDGAFIGTFDEALPKPLSQACGLRYKRSNRYAGWEGWHVRILADVSTPGIFGERGYGLYRSSGQFIPLRDAPDETGYLLDALTRIGSETPGGVSTTPRARIIDTFVLQFP